MTTRVSIEDSILGLVANDMSYFQYGHAPATNTPLQVNPDGGSSSGVNPLLYTDAPKFTIPAGYVVAATIERPDIGAKAIILRNAATNKTIVAMAGTDGPDLQDYVSNTQSFGYSEWQSLRDGPNNEPNQGLFKILDEIHANSGEIVFTGQSLGGAIAQYGAYEWVKQQKAENNNYIPSNISLVTYNGLGAEIQLKHNEGSNYSAHMLDGMGRYPARLYGIQPNIPLQQPEAIKGASSTATQSALQQWLDLAMQNNLTVKLKKISYDLANKAVELNTAGHLPTLDAVANYTRTDANGGINGFGSDLNNTTVGLQLQIPLYQGGAVSSKIREAVAKQQKAQEEIEAARRKVELDTKQAYLEITSSIAQAHANEQTLRSAQSQLTSTTKSFKLGIRNNVDVLNAQQQVFNAKRELLQTHYTYLLGLLKLKYSSGLLSEDDLDEVNQWLES